MWKSVIVHHYSSKSSQHDIVMRVNHFIDSLDMFFNFKQKDTFFYLVILIAVYVLSNSFNSVAL